MTMRISRADLIVGRPAFEIRSFFRHVGWYSLDLERACHRLHLGRTAAKRIVRLLVEEGYLEVAEKYPNDRRNLWKLTEKAVAVTHASGSRPIHRKTAPQRVVYEHRAR